MEPVHILAAMRSPIGSFLGSLATLEAPEIGARVLRATIAAAELEAEDVEQVYFGCVLPAGLGQAPARQVAIGAGCPPSTGAVTLNKVCGSGMQAIMSAANDLRCGDYEIATGGGMECMSRVPHILPGSRRGWRLGDAKLADTLVHDGLWDPYNDLHMGSCAELCVARYELSRQEQDDFALESYRRARAATEEGLFAPEIVPMEIAQKGGGTQAVERDEDPFRVDLDRLPSLRPAFDAQGSVTAGNASNLNDGAAALLLATESCVQRRGLRSAARIVAQASVAQQPEWFTTAPIAAIRKVCANAGIEPAAVDIWEINEAFSAVLLACMRDLDLDHDRVNVNGGAVALGHPIGASGARIVVTLLHAMRQRNARLGCAAICIGGGEATALLVERLED